MIGSITFAARGAEHVATLDDDGSWTVDPPLPDDLFGRVVRDMLRDAVAAYRGPQDGFFGAPQLRAAAARLKGTVHLVPRARLPGPDEVIY